MHDSELRHYTLDRAGIMFVTDLIRDTLTSPTLRRNAIVPEMDVITTLTILTYLATGKMQLRIFRTLLCRCSFPMKYVKYDSMVNKK